MQKIIPLKQILTKKGSQTHLAEMIGTAHQTTISKAHRENRNIFIIENDNGVSAFEIKAVFNSEPDINAISEKLLNQLEPA